MRTKNKTRDASRARDTFRAFTRSYADYAAQGVVATLDNKLNDQLIKLARDAINAALLAESTGAATVANNLVFAAVRAYRLSALATATVAANERLADRTKFDVDIIDQYPLLGCYLIWMMDDNMALGVDAYYFDAPREEASGPVYQPDKKTLKDRQKSLETLRKLAKGRILAAPYALKKRNAYPLEFMDEKSLMVGKYI